MCVKPVLRQYTNITGVKIETPVQAKIWNSMFQLRVRIITYLVIHLSQGMAILQLEVKFKLVSWGIYFLNFAYIYSMKDLTSDETIISLHKMPLIFK